MVAKMYFDISHMRFDAKGKVNVSINEGEIFLSNHDEWRRQFLKGKWYQEYGNSVGRFLPDSVFRYAELQLSETGIISGDDFQKEYLRLFDHRDQTIQALLTFLWLVRDNSVGLYGTFGEIPQMKLVNGKSRSIASRNCLGLTEDTFFSQDDLQLVGAIVTKFSSIRDYTPTDNYDVHILYDYDGNSTTPIKGLASRTPTKFDYKNQNCLDRALNFLVVARSQNYLFYRVAYYMPVFECLFNTSGTEIQYRMGHRVSCYISDLPLERKSIFEKIFKGYNYRSKFIHGQESQFIESELQSLSADLDGFLRKIILQIMDKDLDIFTKWPSDDRGKYLDSLIYGLPFDRKSINDKIISAEADRKKTIELQEEKKRKKAEYDERRE